MKVDAVDCLSEKLPLLQTCLFFLPFTFRFDATAEIIRQSGITTQVM
jgi:hypothetical protein